ncbi:SDR family oxidoreductase [Rhodobacteraceae bacterium NNCM2]|nr:SDR family oxidoreductase [Coraliihabitans acroporae]
MAQQQRTAIVTGGGKGIGAEISKRLAAAGYSVVINYRGDESAARTVASAIEAEGGRATCHRGYVGDPAAMKALFDKAEEVFGPVDMIVNNAGAIRVGPLSEASSADFDLQVTANLAGTFHGMREGARRLRDGGRIVSISSSVVGLYLPGYGLYAATKSAVEAMTHVLAKELGPRQITVNTVSPGPIDTEFFHEGKSAEQVATITRMIPLGRLGRPGDVADVVAYLASPESGWINGQVLRANGGAV